MYQTSTRLLATLLIALCTYPLLAQYENVEIKSQQLSENIYMLTGAGGNIAVLKGEDGVFMIDGQFAPLSEKIKTAVERIADADIKFLINTHWHGDHTGGNENFAQMGATIIAHENVRARLSTEQIMKAFSRTVPASPKAAWPVITFTEDLELYLNGENIMIFHVHNAHTDGDAVVYFPNSNVMHTGDSYFSGRYPFIDLGSGGSVEGVIKAVNQILFLVDDDTKIIPGHGKLSNKKELTAYRDMLMTLRDRMKQAIKAGMTFEEIKAANLSKEYDESWGGGFINPEKMINTLYTDLSK